MLKPDPADPIVVTGMGAVSPLGVNFCLACTEPAFGVVLADLAEALEDALALVLFVDNTPAVVGELDPFCSGSHD